MHGLRRVVLIFWLCNSHRIFAQPIMAGKEADRPTTRAAREKQVPPCSEEARLRLNRSALAGAHSEQWIAARTALATGGAQQLGTFLTSCPQIVHRETVGFPTQRAFVVTHRGRHAQQRVHVTTPRHSVGWVRQPPWHDLKSSTATIRTKGVAPSNRNRPQLHCAF